LPKKGGWTIDRNHYFRTQIDNIFVTASWFEQVKSSTGIRGVSQVWDDRPQWYVWLNDAPGVYGLVLEDADVLETSSEPWYVGQFALKCYPYQNHPVYDSFSVDEKQAVSSPLFDATNTPRLETKKQIPETFFAVGGITLTVNRDESESLLTFESFDRLVVRAKPHPQAPEPVDGSENDPDRALRRVPGWQIGWSFFDSLVSLFAFHHKQQPRFIAATRSPGIEQWIDESGAIDWRPSKKAHHLSLSLMFLKKSVPRPMIEKIWRSHLEGDEKILFEQYLRQPCDQKIALEADSAISINPLWWELACANYQSHMASTCGCSDALHHSHNSLSSLR
jgi:hypothetical protein